MSTSSRQTNARLSPPLLLPDALANPNDVPVEPAVAPAPAPPPFRMTRAQYQALLDNQAAILQSVVDLRADLQAYRDHSQMVFDGYQQSIASLQTDFDQLGARIHDEAFETRTLMHALFEQHFSPPSDPNQ
ncbi:unnamed protein product [Camellia sinensis]